MKKKYTILLIALIALSGCGKPGGKPGEAGGKQEASAKPVKTIKLEKQIITKNVITNSELEAKLNVAHTSEVDGTLEKILVKNGDFVEKGDLIAQFSSDTIVSNYQISQAAYKSAEATYEQAVKFSENEVKNQLVTAESAYTTAKESLKRALRGTGAEELEQAYASYDSTKANYEVVKTTYERYKSLYEKKLISELEYLEYENSFISAKSQLAQDEKTVEIYERGYDDEDIAKLRAAENSAKDNYELIKSYVEEESWNYTIANAKANLDSAKANLDSTKSKYDDLTVEASVSGIVSNLDLSLYTNFEARDFICDIVNDSTIKGEIEVSGSDVASINIGQEVTVYIEDLEKEYIGKITEIYRTANSETKKFPLIVEFENDGSVREGMYAKLTLETLSKTTTAVPNEAIVIKDLASYVFVTENETAKRISVETGIVDGELQEILTSDIKEGMDLVVEGQYLLDNNDKIQIVQ